MKHCYFVPILLQKSLLALLALILLAYGASARIIYVDAGAPPPGDGMTWATAFPDIQQALTIGAYTVGDTVWVAAGTYYPTASTNRSISIHFRNGLVILGGFLPGAASLNSRDYTANPTILSGDIGVPGVSTDNSFHVVDGTWGDNSAIMDGFVIEDGYATNWNGGGMYTNDGAPGGTGIDGPVIRNCLFRNNFATFNGGAMYNDNSPTKVINCTFLNNTANEGGGIYNRESDAVITYCTFELDSAFSYGGGIHNYFSNPLISHSIFKENHAGFYGGGMSNWTDNMLPGGIVCDPIITNCEFRGNVADEAGGGMSCNAECHPEISNCIFSGNFAAIRGGGMASFDNQSRPKIVNCTFSGNHSALVGGIHHNSPARPEVYNSILYGNTDITLNPLHLKQISGVNVITAFNLIEGVPIFFGTNNFSADPLFLSPITISPPTTVGDFRVSKYSPAINKGSDTVILSDLADVDSDGNTAEQIDIDLEITPRIENDTVDVGAYETFTLCLPLGSSTLFKQPLDPTICSGETLNLCVDSTQFTSINWSTGETTGAINVTTSGLFWVSVSDTTGCTASDSIMVQVNPNPIPQTVPGDSVNICTGDTIKVQTFDTYSHYLWSTGDTTRQTNVNMGGILTVLVTDSNECQGIDTLIISENPKPSPILIPTGPTTFCAGDSIGLLVLQPYLQYLWSTGEVSQTINVFSTGNYKVTVVDSNLCYNSDSIQVTVNPNPIVNITASDSLEFCDGDSVVLDAGLFAQYLWSTGDTSQTITVYTSGAYSVLVTDIAGCTDMDTVTVVVNSRPSPLITASPSATFCAGDSAILDGGSFNQYSWSTGDTTQQVTAKTSGLYILSVTDVNGCQGSDSLLITVGSNPSPTITPSQFPVICDGDSVVLDAGSFAHYMWTTGDTTQSITAKTSNTYGVTVSTALGCMGSDTLTVTVNPNPVVNISPSGPTTFCADDFVNLNADPSNLYTSYIWSTGFTGKIINVNTTGAYWVQVTGPNGCFSYDTIQVTVNPLPIVDITPLGDTVFCDGDSVVLDAGVHSLYFWSTGIQGRYITAKSTGPYAVTVVNSFLCRARASITILEVPNPSNFITALGSLTLCPGDSVTLDGGNYVSYNWSTGDTTRQITVDSAGTYILTVTDSLGCVGMDTIATTIGSVLTPTITLSGSSTLCDGDTLILNAGSFPNYTWNTGATTQTIQVTDSGTYIVTVSSASGCVGSDTVVISKVTNPNPSIGASGPTTFCQGYVLTISSTLLGPSYQYLWSTGDSTSGIDVTTSGNYVLTVTDSNNCQGTASIPVTANPNPVASITPSGPTTFCVGDSVTLDAGVHDHYLWSTGDTTSQVTVKTSNTYQVIVTNGFGCSDTVSIVVTVNPNPNPVIVPDGPTTFCNGDSVILDPGIFSSYLWSSGATTRKITVKTSSTNTVTVTNVNGCVGSNSVVVTVNANPTPVISPNGPTTFCQGGSVILDAGSYANYQWQNGLTSRTITVTSSGTNWVRVTDINGCIGSDTVVVTVNPIPNPTITSSGPTTICNGDSVILDAGAGFSSYSWSGGKTTRFNTIKTSGLKIVTVTSAGGCTAKDSVFVTVNPNPVLNMTPAGNPVDVCQGLSVRLGGGIHNSYLWSTGDTTQQLFVSVAGTYTLTVSNSFGCTDTGSKTLIVNPNPTPMISASGPLSFCAGDSVTLDAGPGYLTYTWSPGNIPTQSIVAKTSGNYVVTVEDGNRCLGKDSVQVAVTPLPVATITPLGSTSICSGSSLTLVAGPNGSYLWSTGDTTSSISVSTANTYWVDVSTPDGCTDRDSIIVTVNSQLTPTISPAGPLAICEGNTVLLDAGQYISYLWLPDSATTRRITVDTAGTYIVTVTDMFGCSGSDSVVVTLNPNPTPSISASGPTTFCEGDSVELDAGSYLSYNWVPADTTRIISVKSTGSYSVGVTDINGCAGFDTVQVTVNSNPVVNITTGGNTVGCQGDSISLDGGTHTNYLWSTSETTQVIYAVSTGSYILTGFDTNGCSASDTVDILINALPTPVIDPLGNTSFCDGGSVVLDAGDYIGYLWTGGSSLQTITVTTSGTYTVAVTDTNNCIGLDSVTVSVFPNPVANISPAGINEICEGDTLTLNGGIQPNYLWSTGATTKEIKVTNAGVYSLKVTSINGCIDNDTVTVLTNPKPTPVITASGSTILCPGGTLILDAGPGYMQYNWSTSQTTQTISVTMGGLYIVTVTDSNGCTGVDSLTVTMGPAIMPTITPSGPTTFCDGDSVILDAGMYVTYSWSTGLTSRTIIADTSGLYIVTVTDTAGCIGMDSIQVTVNPNPTPIITPNGPTVFCAGGSVSLDAGVYSQYAWLPGGQTTRTINVTTSGTYTVTVTDTNGCTGMDSISIIVHSNPNAMITSSGPTSVCFGDSVILSSSRNWPSMLWTPSGATSQSIVVKSTQMVYLAVVDSNGCSDIDSVQVSVNPNLTPMITSSTGSTTLCFQDTAILNAGLFARYLWSTGDTVRTIKVDTTGTFIVNVSDNKGCTGTDTIMMTQVQNLAPIITVTGSTTFCTGDSVVLSVSNFAKYQWSRSAGDTLQSLTIKNQSGNYFVVVEDSNKCTGRSNVVPVTVFQTPNGSISPSDTSILCIGDSLILYAGNYLNYLWSDATTDSTVLVVMTDTLSVTVTDTNGCVGMDTYIAHFNDNPVPMITTAGNSFICPGDTITLDAGLYTSYLWSTGGMGRTITRTDSGLYSVMVSDSNGCQGADSFLVSNYQAANAIINPVGSPNICAGNSVYLGVGSFTSYLWSNGATTDSTSQTFTQDTSVYINVMVTDTNGCRDTDSILITVNPNPTPVIVADGSLNSCSKDSLMLDAGSYSNVIWTTGEMTRMILADSIGKISKYTVFVTDSNGCRGIDTILTNIRQTTYADFIGLDSTYCDNAFPDTMTGIPLSGTFFSSSGIGVRDSIFDPVGAMAGIDTIYYAYTAPNGCRDTAEKIVRIFPVGVNLNFPLQSFICDSEEPVKLAATPVGGNFKGTGVFFKPSDGAYYFAPYQGQGIYNIQYTIQGGFGCTDSIVDNITVRPTTPVDIIGLLPSYCLNQGGTVLSANINGGSFIGKNVGFTGIYTPGFKGLDTVIYAYPNANGCNSLDTAYTIVHPAPSLTMQNPNKEFCQNGPPVILNASPSGGTFGCIGCTGAISTNGTNYFFDPSQANPLQNIITYRYPDPITGCDTTINDTFIVNATPVLIWSKKDSIFCPDGPPVFFPATPLGGTYGGPGITKATGIFDPQLVSSGVHTLYYTFTTPFACKDTIFHQIRVDTIAHLSFVGLDSSYCKGTPCIQLQALPGGGTFDGDAVFNGMFCPDSMSSNSATNVLYEYTNPVSGCVDILRKEVRIDSIPDVTFEFDSSFCIQSGITVPMRGKGLPIGTINTGYFFGPLIAGKFNLVVGRAQPPTNPGAGTYPVYYRFEDMNGCADTVTQFVEVFNRQNVTVRDPNGIVIQDSSIIYFCMSDPPFHMTVSPKGGRFEVDGKLVTDSSIVDTTFFPAKGDTSVNIKTYTYKFDDGLGCIDSTRLIFSVIGDRNPYFVNLDSSYCVTDTHLYVVNIKQNGGKGTLIIDGDSTFPRRFSPAGLGVGTHIFQYADYVNPYGAQICPDTLTRFVTIRPAPMVSFTGLDATYCDKQPFVRLNGSPTGGIFTGTGIVGVNTFVPDSVSTLTGIDTITYTYSDEIGCSNSITKTTVVQSAPEGDFEFTEVCLGERSFFTYKNEKPFTPNFRWSFGNGDSAFTVDPAYIYPDPGIYEVLLITQVGQCTDTSSHQVEVYPVPEASLWGDTSVYLGDMAYFFNTSTGGSTFMWQFGDGSISTEMDNMAEYLYGKIPGQDSPWVYSVILTAVNDPYNCSDTDSMLITVRERPQILYEEGVYPNPTYGEVNVNLYLNEPLDIVLQAFDSRGRLVRSEIYASLEPGLNTLEFDLTDVAEGMYMLSILAGDDLLRFGEMNPGALRKHKIRYNRFRKIVVRK